MDISQWAQLQPQQRTDFMRVLGRLPDRSKVSHNVLEPEMQVSPVQQKLIDSNADAHLDWMPVSEEPDNEQYRRIRISYPGGVEGQPVYAFLRIPRRLERPAPAVLCLHGHMGGCLLGKESMSTTAIDLTRRGFVTLTPDMLPFGERRDPKYDEFEWGDGRGSSHFINERAWFQSLVLNGATLQGLHVWELQRAIDLLQELPEVDPARIGAVGHSGGGINTLWLAAMDERVACAGCVAGVMSYSRLAKSRALQAVWSLAPILTAGDTPELLSLVAPRPFLGVESHIDRFGFDGDYNRRHIYPAARLIYDLYGAGSCLTQIVFEGDHDYRQEQRDPIFSWFEQWLVPNNHGRT